MLSPRATSSPLKAMAPKLATGVASLPCASGSKSVGLAGLTKLAEEVIVKDQLEAIISKTVDKSKADYAIVRAWAFYHLESCVLRGV